MRGGGRSASGWMHPPNNKSAPLYKLTSGTSLPQPRWRGPGRGSDRSRYGVQPPGVGRWPVVYHHGQQVGGGHYTCDVLHPCGSWIRVNDEAVSEVSGRDVISEKADRVAYVLFYERAP